MVFDCLSIGKNSYRFGFESCIVLNLYVVSVCLANYAIVDFWIYYDLNVCPFFILFAKKEKPWYLPLQAQLNVHFFKSFVILSWQQQLALFFFFFYSKLIVLIIIIKTKRKKNGI